MTEGKQCRERWHNHLNPEIRKEQVILINNPRVAYPRNRHNDNVRFSKKRTNYEDYEFIITIVIIIVIIINHYKQLNVCAVVGRRGHGDYSVSPQSGQSTLVFYTSVLHCFLFAKRQTFYSVNVAAGRSCLSNCLAALIVPLKIGL